MKHLFLLLFLAPLLAIAQTNPSLNWVNNYKSEVSDDSYPSTQEIISDDTAYVYATGNFFKTMDFDPGEGKDIHTNKGSGDVFVQKIDKTNGDVLWTRTVGGSGPEFGSVLAVDHNGNVLFGGTFDGSIDLDPTEGVDVRTAKGFDDVFVIKLSKDSDYVWGRTIGAAWYDKAFGLAVDADNNVYVGGEFDGGNLYFHDDSEFILERKTVTQSAFVIKISPQGDYVWSYGFSTPNSYLNSVKSLKINASNNLLVYVDLGPNHDLDPGPSVLTIPFESVAVGVIQEVTPDAELVNYVAFPYRQITSMDVDKAGNIYLMGDISNRDTVDFDPGPDELILHAGFGEDILVKVNADLEFEWVNQFRAVDSYWTSVIADEQGNVYAVGSFKNAFHLYRGREKQTTDLILLDGFVTGGVVKYDKDGYWQDYYSVASSGGSYAFGLATDDSSHIYIGGGFGGVADVDPRDNVDSLIYSDPALRSPTVLRWDNCVTRTDTQRVYFCSGDSILSPNKLVYYKAEGTYNDTLQSQGGCDSIVVSVVDHSQGYLTHIAIEACSVYTLPDGGEVEKDSTARYTYPSQLGCDSMVVYMVDILYPLQDQSITACDSLADPTTNGATYLTTSGVYQISEEREGACRQNIRLTLTVVESSTSVVDTVSCTEYKSPSGKLYEESGTYSDTVSNAMGCDSVITIQLDFQEIDVEVIQRNDSLIAKQGGATYQWVNCATNQPLQKETDQGFKPEESGSYKVEVRYQGCEQTSDCVDVIVIGVAEEKLDKEFKVYPNPTLAKLYISGASQEHIQRVVIIDMQGKEVKVYGHVSEALDVSTISKGHYQLHIITQTGREIHQIMVR